MAVALDIRLWFDDDPAKVEQRVAPLRACVGGWAPVEGRAWERVVARDRVAGPALRDAGRGRTDVQWSASTYVRMAGGVHVPLTVDAWGEGWIERAGFGPRELVGDASMCLHQCTPWIAPGEHLDANLEALAELLVRLVDELEPAALRLFTDVAPYLPVDAHAAWFRDAGAVLDDLRLIERAWRRGLPGIEPLAQAEPARAFHEWRGREASAQLHAALAGVIGNLDAVTAGHVDDVLGSGVLDTVRCARGQLVLGDPRFVSSFIDELYLAVLEEARA